MAPQKHIIAQRGRDTDFIFLQQSTVKVGAKLLHSPTILILHEKALSPAIWLVGRLSFPHKLSTAAAFIIPLLILASLPFFDQQRALASIQQKRSGLAVQLPALHLLGALHDHHAAAGPLSRETKA